MIIVNLKGGLGNQMFQYAAGKALATKNNGTLKLYTGDLEGVPTIGNTKRDFGLKDFALTAAMATKEEVTPLVPGNNLLTKILKKIKAEIWGSNHLLFEPGFFSQTGDIYLNGFWQSTRYFNSIRELLLADFQLRGSDAILYQDFSSQIKNCTAVSIHVRRGDYASNPVVRRQFGICSKQYYQNAISAITTKIPNVTFFIFSDEPEWVKNNLKLKQETNVVYIPSDGISDTQSLVLMSQCQHNIIANSSFSWWGAWLNQNPGKIVVAPTPWFDHLKSDADLIPDTWKTLPKNPS